MPPRLAVMNAVRLRVAELVVPEDDDTPPARRSRSDWIVDCALFLLATTVGGMALGDQIDRGLGGPLLFLDVLSGAALCLGLWWRRRWPLILGLASVPIQTFSSSAGIAAGIILFTVAAYRRWQLALLVGGGLLLAQPVYHA